MTEQITWHMTITIQCATGNLFHTTTKKILAENFPDKLQLQPLFFYLSYSQLFIFSLHLPFPCFSDFFSFSE